jgi:predicted naringenin-chalcone synthase
LAKIVNIATGVPANKTNKYQIIDFITNAYQQNKVENRKMRFLQSQAGIETRYTVVPDYILPKDYWQFFPKSDTLEPFPDVTLRMHWYEKFAADLCCTTITNCIKNFTTTDAITHLITVSCTGMSAPGLDLQIAEQLQLQNSLQRTSVNFMGCYAAVHGLKLAQGIIATEPHAKVVLVCLEFCSLHFQKEYTNDNITACVLFADGCAAALLEADDSPNAGVVLNSFYSEVNFNGKKDMAWEIAPTGFLMKLTGYVTDLIKQDFDSLLNKALAKGGISKQDIDYWCLHPGGKSILEAIEKTAQIDKENFNFSYDVLRNYGNMSSATILFVLQQILRDAKQKNEKNRKIFGAAFGPGLTMETFTATYA